MQFDRHAFTPLIDDSDDEDIEEFVASANIGTVTPAPYLTWEDIAANTFVFFVFLCHFSSHYLFFFLFKSTADGIKLRSSKSETNGTVKPAETNPVSVMV